MPPADKPTSTGRPKRPAGAIEKDHGQKSTGGPAAQSRPRPPADSLHSAGKKGRKVPFGPVGGSGRKTNLSRSS